MSILILPDTITVLVTSSVAFGGQVRTQKIDVTRPNPVTSRAVKNRKNSYNRYDQYMATVSATGKSINTLMATKSAYQDNYYRKMAAIPTTMAAALGSDIYKYSAAYTGSDSSINNTIGNSQGTLETCLTEALKKKFNTPDIDEENEIFGYLLWWFDETIAAIERIVKSATIPDGKKAESVATIVKGCVDFSNSTSISVTDYKNKIVDNINKSVLSAAPPKPTTLNIDSVYITVFAKSTVTGFTNPGKGNYCNTVKDLGGGDKEWTNPKNSLALDGVASTIDLAPNQYSNKLKITDCNIILSSLSTEEVFGVKVDIRRSITTNTKEVARDREIKLMVGDREIGTNNASMTAWKSSYSIDSFGGENDNWEATILPSDIKKIGVVISVKNEGVPPAQTAVAAPTTDTIKSTTITTTAAPAKKNPLMVLLDELKAKGAISPKSEGSHVKALQDVIVTLKMGKPAEELDKALKGGTGSGVAGNITVAAYDFLNQFLAYWAEKNNMLKDEDFVAVIKSNGEKVKVFGVANAQSLVKYVQQSQKKK